jgi:hypothetical protein
MNVGANRIAAFLIVLLAGLLGAPSAPGQEVRLLERAPDPHGAPRPARGARDVPLGTSLYLELAMPRGTKSDAVEPDSLAIRLGPEGDTPRDLLRPGRRFAEGASGWLRPKRDLQGEEALAVYLEPGFALRPSTSYTVHVTARSRAGVELPEGKGTWAFTTEAAPRVHALTFPLDLKAEPVLWRGAFFSGFGNVSFCTSAATFGPTYDVLAEARKEHPRAWSLQRDFWMTGTEHRPVAFFPQNLPNAVRERETRRIATMETRADGVLLHLEDLFDGAQYGIPPGRPVADDYHPGDEVLIADGVHDARARVLGADDKARTVLVSRVETPPGGWKLAYEGPLPTRENPDAPGLFASGGCYLRKFNPHGTPCYYWGRLDKEWDLAHRRYGRRLLPNFADAPGDLARDGRAWTTVKDYAEWHDVARTLAGHVIDRYGADALDFVWSIFNEPDLGALFWRADWDELQQFYDYTTDAILRAFEDRGYDSDKVFIGGLELGGIFGTNLRLREFLAHCSPRAEAKGALPRNAALADKRLDGKRSRRVEALGRAHGGKGSPCDFVSIHSYNRSEMMAAKLLRAKEIALEIDPEYYRALWVNSHESCPDWMPPPDEAAADSYLGNGYFPTWCADVARRQLRRAADDPRFAYGETILTVWPPSQNFAGMNAVTRVLQADDDGDGRADRGVTIPMPVFHALNLLSDMGPRYRVLPERVVGGHVVSGFASRGEGAVRVLLYAHQAQDTQARSEAEFDVTLELEGLSSPRARVREYRFDKEHNSYFRLGRALRDREPRAADPARLDAALRALDGDDSPAQREALKTLGDLGPPARSALPAVLGLLSKTRDEGVRAAAQAALGRITAAPAYPRAEVERVRALAELRPTASTTHPVGADGRLRLTARVAGNGLNVLVLEEEAPPR